MVSQRVERNLQSHKICFIYSGCNFRPLGVLNQSESESESENSSDHSQSDLIRFAH